MSKVISRESAAPGRAVAVLLACGLMGAAVAQAGAVGNAPASLLLARDGATEYVIIQGADSIPAEQTAARELAEYLKKVTGAEFRTVAETAAEKPAKAIYVGWTKFAASKGIECARLGCEEWVVRTFRNDLVITGGRPRGTLYGVYDFLEKELGVYWLDRDTEVVPKRPTLALAAIDRRAIPVFRMRMLSTAEYLLGFDAATGERNVRYNARNRNNWWYPAEITGSYDMPGSPGGGAAYYCHNFGKYVPGDKYFVDHPEYYALDKDGKTRLREDEFICGIDQSGKKIMHGSLCLTHPEVRKIALATLLETIATDRKTVNPNQPPPDIYIISQPDNYVVCHCPGCREFVEREGAESGPLIDFVNEIADGIRGQFPDVKVMFHAYLWSMVPPKTIRPRENVAVWWCDNKSADALTLPDPEPWFPLTAPANALRAENLRQWAAITPAGLMIWDYGQPNTVPAWPFTPVPALLGDMRFFADFRILGFLLESEEWGFPIEGPWRDGHFSPLYNWLAMLLMVEPRRPVEPLMDVFFAGYYGPAAAPMRAFYDKLAAAQRGLPPRAGVKDARQIEYVNAAFFAESEALLEQAEGACAADSLELAHVRRERFRLDIALIEHWDILKEKLAPGAAMPFDREAVLARLDTHSRPLWLRLGYPAKRVDDFLSWKLPLLRSPVELPERFRHLPQDRVVQYYWRDLYVDNLNRVWVNDPEAAGLRAVRCLNTTEEHHQADPVFGLWDLDLGKMGGGPTLTIPKAEVPQDGKYHWYKVGIWRITPGTHLWGHSSWSAACHSLFGKIAVPTEAPWEVWVSAKFTGPAYIRDSKDTENGFYLDRVILVRPDADDGE